MSRPVYYFDSENVDYTFITKDPWEVEFHIAPQEMSMLRKPRAFLSTKSGRFQMSADKVKKMPGPPVDGKLLIRVAGYRMN